MPVIKRGTNTQSFFRGMARALDLRGAVKPTYGGYRSYRMKSDHAAIASDWSTVWSDLGSAFSGVASTQTSTSIPDEREAHAE
jgi:hypothetical protein